MTARAPRAVPTTAALEIYERLGRFPGPFLTRLLLERRARNGKEEPARLGERFGRASVARPEGVLLWFHAASVGETLSLLPLIERLRGLDASRPILLTTGTRTSAEIAARRAPEGVIHQFAPVDLPAALELFLDHWRPALLGVVESEIWPSMLAAARRRGVPTALLSARLSARSAAGWARAPRSIAALLSRFDLLMAQNEQVATRLLALGADRDRVTVAGSLKDAAAALPADPEEVAHLSAELAGRPLWIAASTHAGEETAVIAAHQALAARTPNLLTVIAPRHPERCDALMEEIKAAGLRGARRAERAAPAAGDTVFVIDRLGELGLWFRLAPLAFIGGSLGLGATPIGGHNPLEPARLGATVLFGPDMANFDVERRRLLEAEAALEVAQPEDLAAAVGGCLGQDGALTPEAAAIGARAQAVGEAGGEAVLKRYEQALATLLEGEASEATASGADLPHAAIAKAPA